MECVIQCLVHILHNRLVSRQQQVGVLFQLFYAILSLTSLYRDIAFTTQERTDSILQSLMVASTQIHSFLAHSNTSSCVNNRGALLFFTIHLIALMKSRIDEYGLELCQCLACMFGGPFKSYGYEVHSIRYQYTAADILPLDAYSLYIIQDTINSLVNWKELAVKIRGLLIEWSDIECRRIGRGHLTKECMLLGVYDLDIMGLVHRFQRFHTEVCLYLVIDD